MSRERSTLSRVADGAKSVVSGAASADNRPVTDHLETDRLRLRRFTAADLDDVHALHSDPAVMRYLDRPATREHVRDTTLPQLRSEEKPAQKYAGPVEQPTSGEIELGYRLHQAAWGRGFAAEGSIALVKTGSPSWACNGWSLRQWP